jgi:hypothetical protein
MKYFTIVGIIAHIAIILYLFFSFILGDFNFINWGQKCRVVYILFLVVIYFLYVFDKFWKETFE